MSDIRLTYTGIKYFILRFIAYLIGIAFPIYVARLLPATEFGIYGFIASLWGVFDVFKNMIPFWAGRMIARGENLAKSSLISNFLISLPLSIIYLSLIPLYPSISNNYYSIYILSVLYLPITYPLAGLRAYISMRKTDKLGYEPIIFNLTKVSIGLIIVYLLGLTGAIQTILFGYLLILIYYLKLSVKEFEERVEFERVIEWVKGSWYVLALSVSLVFYNNLPVLMLGFLNESSLGAYYAAVKVASWITLTTGLSVALTPRLLSEAGGMGDVERALSLLLMFSTPMLVGIFALNTGIIHLLGGRKYMDALIPLFLLALARYINVLATVGINTILGFEKFDKYFKVDLRELIRSDMLKVLFARYLGLIVLAASIIILYPLYLIDGLALSVLIASITLFIIVSAIFIRKLGSLPRIGGRLLKYSISSAIMGLIVYILPKYRSLLVILSVFIGAGIYFTVLYLIDREFRVLVKKGLDEIARILLTFTFEE